MAKSTQRRTRDEDCRQTRARNRSCVGHGPEAEAAAIANEIDIWSDDVVIITEEVLECWRKTREHLSAEDARRLRERQRKSGLEALNIAAALIAQVWMRPNVARRFAEEQRDAASPAEAIANALALTEDAAAASRSRRSRSKGNEA